MPVKMMYKSAEKLHFCMISQYKNIAKKPNIFTASSLLPVAQLVGVKRLVY